MKKLSAIFVFLGLLIMQPAMSCASMKLYISDDCANCELFMEEGKEPVEVFKARGELEVINVTGIATDLPALPALVDGKMVIIGIGIKEYLEEKVGIGEKSNDGLPLSR